MLFTKRQPMPTNRMMMRQIRETLRLHLSAGLSFKVKTVWMVVKEPPEGGFLF